MSTVFFIISHRLGTGFCCNFAMILTKISNYSEQFLYHIELEAGKSFSISLADKIEAAAFLTTQNLIVNDAEFQAGEFIEFSRKAGEIELKNTSHGIVDVLLFGGEEYTEKIVAEGPFVMNSTEEIVQAYQDFYAGKYDKIDLKTKN